ncbi:MAG: RNA polymerase sigma factor [Caulobacteraceae bacterium]|nr:RNA polymerase sigma factor [Caulobacteraceae bacterium]
MSEQQGRDLDDVLLARLARGEPGAAAALVAAKLPRVLALAARTLGDAAEAEDVAQEAFERVWRHARRWRPGGARFDTWLHRVTLNLCYDRLRRRRETPVAQPPERADPSAGPERGLAAADTGQAVAAALAVLPPRQRDAIVLCHYQELSNIEAAAVLEVTVEALESLLARARRRLRELLADQRP